MENRELFKFIFESTPDLINFTDRGIRNYDVILFSDSIFEFYPLLDVTFADPTGVIPDATNFVEGLEFTAKLGDNFTGYIGGQYIWYQNEFNDITITDSFSGKNTALLSSKHLVYDFQRNRSWNNTIKNIITEIAYNDFSLLPIECFFSNTTGVDYWYQSNEKNSRAIQRLGDSAYDAVRPKSPYYTFFNSSGEFYFMHLYDLFTQEAVNKGNPYVIEFSSDTDTNPYSIKNYLINMHGLELNFNLYQLKNYNTTSTGESTDTTHYIKDFMYSNGLDKFLLRNQYDSEGEILYTNIVETLQDKNNIQGLINSVYRNSALSYRMEITVPFNPKVVSGKVIELKLESGLEQKQMLKEYSGKWLVTSSWHSIDRDGVAFSKIDIAKSTMFVDSLHPFRTDFMTVI